jgi:triphosphoribosyl-dephospho-CoA synthase
VTARDDGETMTAIDGNAIDGTAIGTRAQLACLLEVSAHKPGNVSPDRHFHDTRYEDFLASAVAIGPLMAAAPTHPIGRTVIDAVTATTRWTRANTNLGIILLFAPLAHAAGDASRPLETDAAHRIPALRATLAAALAATTVDDARLAYAAIRHVAPGGLGDAPSADVADDPAITLRAAMALAADRDAIAREYVTDFSLTFDHGIPALARARQDHLPIDTAIVETFLGLLATTPDTHIARKRGAEAAAAVSAQAADVLAAGGVRTPRGRDAIAAFDAALRDPGNASNPGTTADLTAATLFVTLLAGHWPL